MMVACSWSGGKDSCFACYKAIEQGYQVKYLLNLVSKEHQRCCFHGISCKDIHLQAKAVGIPLIQKEVTADMETYEIEFKEAVSELKAKGVTAIVFGDIYLEEHFDWVTRVCEESGVRAIEPLWGAPPVKLAKDFISQGFKTILVSGKADVIPKEFMGKIFDLQIVEELIKKNVCPCGENGEFHTLVIDGPIFKQALKIEEQEVIFKKGFWDHWFLNIKKINLENEDIQ